MIKTIDAGKACDKIQHPFMIQILSKLETEWDFLHLIKSIRKNLGLTSILNGERMNGFPQDWGKGEDIAFTNLFQHSTRNHSY